MIIFLAGLLGGAGGGARPAPTGTGFASGAERRRTRSRGVVASKLTISIGLGARVILRQLLDPDLGCATYLLGDEGRGVVVDPGLDVEGILVAAAAEHVSGRALLAQRTGAAVRLPAGGRYDPQAGDDLHDAETIDLGALRLTVRAAPGHRPEHVVLLAADRSRS